MASSGFFIPITEQLDAFLSELPVFQQQRLFENAVHKALDQEGWPAGERGTVSAPTASWYVVVFKHGAVTGHVGPLLDRAAANRCVRSWRDGGTPAKAVRKPVGPCLTNAGIESRDIYFP